MLRLTSAWLKRSVLFIPLCLLAGCAAEEKAPQEVPGQAAVRTGADRVWEEPYRQWIAGKRVGLITNHTGVDSQLRLTAQRMQESPEVDLTAVFGPEHGFLGLAQAGEEVASLTRDEVAAPEGDNGASDSAAQDDNRSGNQRPPAVYSLYGETRAPTGEMLREVDVLVYDIQDLGVRFYTFISTLAECLKAAAANDTPFIVLDRPAPLNGDAIEGPLLEEDLRSFVGVHPLPVRYGLTSGELARLLAAELELEVDLRVVPLEGWTRSMWYEQTGLEWIAPSPNMPTLSTATVYPGLCLIEGTNLSEGRGTTRPFEWIGAPWLDAAALADRLNELGLAGVRFRPQAFQPTFSKFAGRSCNGIQVHVLDRDRFDSLETALHIIGQVRQLHPDRLTFRPAHFDRLIGDSSVRPLLESDSPPAQILETWKTVPAAFSQRRLPYLLY
ncbi:MAG TPA: DUF1343 domain-containing protein [Acidobacteriota bacterium]|nr:DUF1343 domain-containing protein [Acidobacteriota bacterium]